MGEVVESTAEEVGTEVVLVQPANLFGAAGPGEVVERATMVADALKDVIVKKGLFTIIQGKAHVRVDGWQLCGAMVGINAVCVATEPVEGGFKATVEARTQDGRVVGRADAVCTKDEAKWKSRDDYARLSMAQTRATSKALKGPLGFVISLAGYSSTPAEEMTFAVPDEPARASSEAGRQTEEAKRKPRGLLEHTRAAIRAKDRKLLTDPVWADLTESHKTNAEKAALLASLNETYEKLGGDPVALRQAFDRQVAA